MKNQSKARYRTFQLSHGRGAGPVRPAVRRAVHLAVRAVAAVHRVVHLGRKVLCGPGKSAVGCRI